MSRLRTAFPFGLNDRLGDDFIKEDQVLVRSKCPVLRRKSSRICRGSSPFLNEFLIRSNFHIQNDSKSQNTSNFSKIHLLSVKKKNLKGTVVFLNKSLQDTDNSLFTR